MVWEVRESSSALRDILEVQKRDLELLLSGPFVEREVGDFRPAPGLATVVLGPRRAGKTVFAAHLARRLGPFGYVNFDDERIEKLADIDALLAAIDLAYGSPRRLLLDELQNLPRWELVVNRLLRQGYELVITGSNAHLLSSEFATHLTGRHLPVVLFPFSFPEFLRAARVGDTETEASAALGRYAEDGGFPEPLLRGAPRGEYLRVLLRSVLWKDVAARHRIRAPGALEDLAYVLLANAGRETSSRSLALLTKCRSPHTGEKYLRHLKEAFLFFRVPRFSFKAREQRTANRKVYCVDNGFISAAAFRASPSTGQLYENLVAIALHRRALEGRCEVFFYRAADGQEVDFVVKEGTRVARLIQVCARFDVAETKHRELRALLKASEELECAELLVLTESVSGEREESWFGRRGTVRYVPLATWLRRN